MRKTFIGIICALGMAALSARVEAATANFQGNCTNNSGTINCVFDAQRPSTAPSSCTSPAYITQYYWDFGDSSDTSGDGFTTSSFKSHSYTPPHDAAYNVHLSVFCSDGSSSNPDASRWVCATIGFPGCIFYGQVWN